MMRWEQKAELSCQINVDPNVDASTLVYQTCFFSLNSNINRNCPGFEVN